MDDDDAFPNFGNAYAGASPSNTSSASWNPALRPDTEPEKPAIEQPAGGDDDDFFDRYQEPTPRKKRLDMSTRNDDAEEAVWGSPVPDQRISVEEEVLVTKEIAEPEELGMQPGTTTDVEAPISHHDHPVDEESTTASQDEDAAVFDEDQTIEEQAWGLEEHMPELANEVPPAVAEPAMEGVDQVDHEAVHEESHRPEEHYDYQGEVTEMENAVDESAEAPLMADEQPTPVLGLVSRVPTFEAQPNGVEDALDGQIEQVPLEAEAPPATIERSFTTNFTEPPHQDRQESITEQSQVVDQDWPAAGDDKTFGDLLDNQQTSEPEPLTDATLPTEQPSEFSVRNQASEPEWPTSGNDNAFDEIAQDTANEVPQIEKSVADEELDAWGTSTEDTTFDALLGNQSQPKVEATPLLGDNDDMRHGSNTADEQWPDEGVDDTFDELLGNQAKESNLPEGLAIENAHIAPGPDAQPIEEDLSAAFAAALDDDDILDDNELDPATLFGDDDDGLLDDDDFLGGSQDDFQVQSKQPSVVGTSYTPSTVQHAFQQPTISTPGTPFIEQNMSRSGGTPSTGLFDVHDQLGSSQQPQRPPITSAQSFVDKAKGGYQSPYDLPMEVVKPRRRPAQTPRETSSQMPAPPPRSSSFHQPPAPPNGHPTPPMPNTSNMSMAPPSSAGGTPSMPPQFTPKTSSGFFEDLPMKPKTLRAKPSMTYVPQAAGAPTPPLPPSAQFQAQQGPPMRSATQPPPRPTGPPTPAQHPTAPGGLTQPGKTPLFSDQPSPPDSTNQPTMPNAAGNGRYSPLQTTNAAPAASDRYSPAPAPSAQVPSAKIRYSPAPAGQSQTQPQPIQRNSSAPQPTGPPAFGRSPQTQPFAPRTSSPLAMHGRPLRTQQDQQDQAQDVPQTPISPPTVNGLLSPERRGSTGAKYTPPGSVASLNDPALAQSHPGPPQRSRTQSPGAVMKTARTAAAAFDRPVATDHAVSPLAASLPPAPTQQATNSSSRPVRLAHRRQFSRDLSFAVPQDERAQDPLERWKGHPIFTWSPSGTIVHSFPKQSAFYAAGHGIPSIKCTPGTISMEDASTFMPMNERDSKFPGPLTARSKGKKKELLSWMTGKIEDLERETEGVLLDFNLPTEVQKGTEEKLVLWKIVKVYLEHDGVLEGTSQIEEEVRKILLPNLAQMGQVADLQSPAAAAAQPDSVDASVLMQLRQALFEGQRERAVWIAEEKKFWGHALLLASTMGPDMWKQIVASFIRSQVRTGGSDARSLAALYQVFAGSAEDCVDELVPPSARAGFLMMSKTDGSRAGNPLEGLDKWRETLALVTSNRTPTDVQSLVALGKLLAGYGRSEAAHTCYLFARQLAKHSGSDDPDASFVLLGANHAKGDANLDSIMLTEIYEYATSLSAPSSAVNYLPHLQSYKLMHGQQLAAYGHKQKAESYCSHIDQAVRSTTKPSGYYNQTLAQELISFNAFLSQTPQTAGSKNSLFSRPAMDKVSSGVGSWFTKFVAGDEGETDPNNAAQGQGSDGSPFGAVSTNQSTISRTSSSAELYNPMMATNGLQPAFQPAPLPAAVPASVPSRYAPGGAASVPPQPSATTASANRYAPSVPSQFAPSRSSMDSDRSYEPQIPSGFGMAHSDSSRPSSSRMNSYAPQSHAQQSPQMLSVPRPETERSASDGHVPYNDGLRRGSAMSQVSNQSYEPKPMFAEQDGFGYGSPKQHEEPSAAYDPEGGVNDADQPSGAAETQSFDAETGGSYEPPSSGYEPPAYQPYEPEPEAEEEEAPKRRKQMMDDEDDDDIVSRAAALKSQKSQQSSEADRQADAAFRAAAEADAARGQDDKQGKKAWFGGWFGGKKEQMPGPGPVRAKLGEENSFYFDKDLNKWVNKKGGADAATPAASTPPPPKGPPSRVASAAASGPPSMGPPSRAASGAGSRPPTSSGPPMMGSSGPPSGPPSRVGTPASVNGGPPGVLNGPAGAALMPPPRPSSSLSHASSLDDLLGGPPSAGGGKKGTVKGGKKKSGRYVDVMAAK